MRARRVAPAVCVLLLLLAPAVARAWGNDGHQIVCDIAWRNLTPAAKTAVGTLLTGDADVTLARACSWADRVLRGRDPSFDLYHYLNLPKQAAAIAMCSGKCVLSGITHYAALLKNPATPREQRLFALKFLGHLVGDVHQPLHVSYRSNRWGNDVEVRFNNQTTTLYTLWNTAIIRHRQTNWKVYAQQLAAQINPIDRTLWHATDPLIWAAESYQIVEDSVYQGIDGVDLAGAYFARSVLIIENRLQAAGVRLAALLNRLLGPE